MCISRSNSDDFCAESLRSVQIVAVQQHAHAGGVGVLTCGKRFAYSIGKQTHCMRASRLDLRKLSPLLQGHLTLQWQRGTWDMAGALFWVQFITSLLPIAFLEMTLYQGLCLALCCNRS